MSLDVYLTRKKWISYDAGKTLTEEDETVYDANITHAVVNSVVNLDDTLAQYHRYQIYVDVWGARNS